MDTMDDVYYLCRMMWKALRQLRHKCRRHNADYTTDSAIPDTVAGSGARALAGPAAGNQGRARSAGIFSGVML